MQETKHSADTANVFERRGVSVLLNATLFIINFLLFYFIWVFVFQDITGFARLALCWVGAYTLTWIMTLLAKGTAKFALTLIFLGLLYAILIYKP